MPELLNRHSIPGEGGDGCQTAKGSVIKTHLKNNGVGGGREGWEGGDICMPMADSCWCMAETSTKLESNYPSIKNKLKYINK